MIEAQPYGSLVNGFLGWRQCGIDNSLGNDHPHTFSVIIAAMFAIVATIAIIAPAHLTRDPFGLA